jgi:hypothetical protein
LSSAVRTLLKFRGPPVVERCELCGHALNVRHEHVHSQRAGGLVCACSACAALLSASEGPYRRVERFVRPVGLAASRSAELLRRLGIPVRLACLQARADGSLRALYPGPLGVAESELAPEAWRACRESFEQLPDLRPEVEALVVPADGQCQIASIDMVYELIGVFRKHRTSSLERALAFLDRELGVSEPHLRDGCAWQQPDGAAP